MSYPQPGPNPYSSAPSAGPGGQPQRLRGRRPLQLSLIFFVVGLALVIVGSVVLAKKSFDKVSGFQRVPVATGGTVNLTRTGNYLAYYEASDVTSGITRVPVPAIRLTGPSGAPMVLDTLYGGKSASSGNITTKLTYDYKGHRGVAIYQFKISQAGQYRVEVGPSSAAAPNSDIAFGESIGKGTALGAALVLPGVLLLIAAIILLIVGLVRRSGHKKQLRSGQYGGPGGPGGYPPPQFPPGQQPYGQQPAYPQPYGQQPTYPQPNYPQPGQQPNHPQPGQQQGYPPPAPPQQ